MGLDLLKNNLNGWKTPNRLLEEVFSRRECDTFYTMRRNFTAEEIVFLSWENRFARSGGLAAVVSTYPPYLQEVTNLPVSTITPYHEPIMDVIINRMKKKPQFIEVASSTVAFEGRHIPIHLLMYEHFNVDLNGRRTVEYYVQAPGFFDAFNRLLDTYFIVPEDLEMNLELLKRQALFFCKAVPIVLKELGKTDGVAVMAHDWTTALASLTIKEAILSEKLNSVAVYARLHNTYDAALPNRYQLSDLAHWSDERQSKIRGFTEPSALSIGLQLMDGPITAVSEGFAPSLTTDLVQTVGMAEKLQPTFISWGVPGINNGPFQSDPRVYTHGGESSLEEIAEIKKRERLKLLDILEQCRNGKTIARDQFGEISYNGGSLLDSKDAKGETVPGLPDDVPIFVMTGRLDPNQKGYDIFLRAIDRFQKGEIKVVLTPMYLRERDLDLFHDIEKKHHGDILVLPDRMTKGYFELQNGATYSVWPSIFEPFGGVIELLPRGTPVIARRTGGLPLQVQDNVTGFLYNENTSPNPDDIKSFFGTRWEVKPRENNSWANSMADALYNRMKEAIDVFKQRTPYHKMIQSGLKQSQKFGWVLAGQQDKYIIDNIPNFVPS